MSDPHWFNGPHVPHSFDYLNEYTFSQPRKPLVIDDELRELTAKVRERLALVGNHRIAPGYEFALVLLEDAFFYEDTDETRAKLKTQFREYLERLDDILAREGTEREREERRAEAIANDRRKIMAYCRQNAHDRDRVRQWHFKAIPMRWFDDWSRVLSHYDDEPVVPPRPDGGYRWDTGERADPLKDLQEYQRSFRARWPERNEHNERMRFIRSEPWGIHIDGAFPPRSPRETEALRAWANYLLQTELFDRSGPHEMRNGEAVPYGPHGQSAGRYAAQARDVTTTTCKRLVGVETSARLRREVNEHVRHATRNGGDVVKALERYLEQLPSPLSDEELLRLLGDTTP